MIKAAPFKLKMKVNDDFTNFGILWGKLAQENLKPLFQTSPWQNLLVNQIFLIDQQILTKVQGGEKDSIWRAAAGALGMVGP